MSFPRCCRRSIFCSICLTSSISNSDKRTEIVTLIRRLDAFRQHVGFRLNNLTTRVSYYLGRVWLNAHHECSKSSPPSVFPISYSHATSETSFTGLCRGVHTPLLEWGSRGYRTCRFFIAFARNLVSSLLISQQSCSPGTVHARLNGC